MNHFFNTIITQTLSYFISTDELILVVKRKNPRQAKIQNSLERRDTTIIHSKNAPAESTAPTIEEIHSATAFVTPCNKGRRDEVSHKSTEVSFC